MDERPKIEVVRVSSTERRNFRPLDGVQLRAAYSHVRVGTYCTDVEIESAATCENKPPPGGGQSRKFKKNLGPVSRLLRRRHHHHHQGACLATKSCDNIYNVNRNSGSLDWRMGQSATDPELQARQSNSLDWRVGRTVNQEWRDASRSAEQLSRSPNFNSTGIHSSTAKSKIVSLLRRLSPRLPRPGQKTSGASASSSPSTVCPWLRVEYSSESVNEARRDESQESDVSFQRELQLNELKKRMLGGASPLPSSSSATSQARLQDAINHNGNVNENANTGSPRIQKLGENPADYNPRSYRAVHEDRSTKEAAAADAASSEVKSEQLQQQEEDQLRRRRPRRGAAGHGEVAGLEDIEKSAIESSLPASGSSRQNRRTRPLSLAVQPLNYHRLDPELSAAAGGDEEEPAATSSLVIRASGKHPNMTSQESIGSCSLDVDRSASDRSETTLGSVSEKTLHSLNLSCNGEAASPQENLSGGSNETLQKQQQQSQPVVQIECLNGENGNAEPEQLTAKKPSYLGLACSISGYSGITRYDSKLREGFRSRDSSPGSRLITRETSPAGFRSNENLGVPGHSYPTKSQSISPLAMDRQNGFSNGAKECKIESFVETRSSINVCQGYSEVDKGLPMHTNFADLSPIRATSPVKRTQGMMHVTSCSRETKSFTSSISVSSPRSFTTGNTVSNNSFSETSFTNGSSTETNENQMLNISTTSSEKSFIQQRVERLYGPGALAQGFFFKRGSGHLNSSDSSFNKSNSSNNNDISADNANTEESLKNLPVLRHLRPEFRAQLPVVSPRKATDGSEQVIKPLQRISVTPPRKAEVKVKVGGITNLSCSVVEKDGLKLSASVTSIPDQQPAAPEVVLPVLEPSASSSSISASVSELSKQPAENVPEEKDGHYFIKLLKAERERLFALAASAEAELADTDPAELPEEAAGKLRSAAGKARLLATQKMQQFEGLCHKNINQVPGEEFPTTNEDLAGFWDMVMLQVVQVNDIFAQIDKLRSSQWQEVIPEKKPLGASSQNGNAPKRRLIVTQRPKPTATSEANRKAREARELARRQMIEDRRRAMRSNAQKEDDGVKIFAPET